MGMQAEFNWYIVLKGNNVLGFGDERETLDEGYIATSNFYHFKKDDYRIYPMETPLPLIYNGRCLAIASIHKLEWKDNKTYLTVEPLLVLNEDDPTREYYENQFKQYKREQQKMDDGGKINVRDIITPESRVRI